MEEHQDQDRRLYDKNVAILEERVSNWMETTTEYRKSLCGKLDIVLREISDMKETFAKLPCRERDSRYNAIEKQISFMWVVVSAMVLGLLKEMFF